MKIKVSQNLKDFAKIVAKKADLYLVGGYVRDNLMGSVDSDVDLASKLSIDDLMKLTQNTPFKVKEKNKKLGTAEIIIKNEIWEHTTFRKEKYPQDGSHSPNKISFVTDIRQDAKRRDFTVNSIYYNILKDEIIDIYSGLYDIRKRVLKTIETPEYVFENDGLRILRMVRLACELNFKIDRETYSNAKQRVYRLKDISGTRKSIELFKILNSPLKSFATKSSYYRGLKMFNNLGIWQTIFPGVNKINYIMLKKVKQEDKFFGLLIDLINTLAPDCVSYYLEYALSKDGLMFSKAQQKEIINIISGYFDALNGLNNKMFFYSYYNQFDTISRLLLKTSIFKYRKYNFYYKYINKFKIPTGVKDIKLSGQDLKENFPQIPLKKYSAIFLELFNLVFDGKVKNEKELLLKEVAKII